MHTDNAKYIAVDRNRILFGDRINIRLLRVVARCKCIEPDIKAVLADDESGASLIVLSKEKLKRLDPVTREKMLGLLSKVNAIRDDVVEYSNNITIDEKVRRDIYKSRFEVEAEFEAA
jgi:hypothetical protein